jgi:ABC-2 type transport system ATP-binding protein
VNNPLDAQGSVIRTSSLTRRFGDVVAVHDLSLDIPPGSIFGFLGPNGAGKTTTIRLLLGLIEPTSGAAEVCGFNPTTDGAQVRRRAGSLLEHSGVYERLSGEENLEFYGRIADIPTRERRERIAQLLNHFGLWDRRKTSTGTWSRGMKQKLAIARAILHKPELVFLDEPTEGLDPAATASLRDDIASMARDTGSTIFLTTNNLAEAERLCDIVGIIVSGRLVACGPPQSLGVTDIRRSGTSLEDVYLSVTQARATNVG